MFVILSDQRPEPRPSRVILSDGNTCAQNQLPSRRNLVMWALAKPGCAGYWPPPREAHILN